jgi:hypothetical protein
MESITDALSIIKILRVLISGLGRFAAKRVPTPSQPFTTLLVKDNFGSGAVKPDMSICTPDYR